MVIWTLIGNVIVGTIIYAGVTAGIERAVTIMMPLMFSLLVGLSVYNYFAGGFIETCSGCSRRISAKSPAPPFSRSRTAFFSLVWAWAA